MDPKLAATITKAFTHYLNRFLSEYVDYRENYTVTVERGYINLIADNHSDLGERLARDELFKDSETKAFENILSVYEVPIYKVFIKPFYFNNKNISVYYISSGQEIVQLDLPLHSLIASYLNTVQLKLFCMAMDPEKITEGTSFWYEMMRVKYPEYIAPGVHDWKRIYNYLNSMTGWKTSPKNILSGRLVYISAMDDLWFYNYLFENDLIKLVDNTASTLLSIGLLLTDKSVINIIYNNISHLKTSLTDKKMTSLLDIFDHRPVIREILYTLNKT